MILAIVQARMNSSRLPGKVLKEILAKPVIGYLFERLHYSKRIDKIILATSDNPENDALCAYVKSLGFLVFRGSENNVLERYYLAAKYYSSTEVVRITGDCPLIDPEICDRLIEEFFERKADYAFLGPTFAEGLDCEIMKFSVLEKSYLNATLLSQQEHVTQYVHNHKDQFEMFRLDNSQDHSRYRIVLDEPQDFEMLKVLFENYYGSHHPHARFLDIKLYLDAHPQIMKINADIIRNEGLILSLKNDRLIRRT